MMFIVKNIAFVEKKKEYWNVIQCIIKEVFKGYIATLPKNSPLLKMRKETIGKE